MPESQDMIDLRMYSRWEIAAARERVATECAFFAGILAAIGADLKWGWWVWTVLAFVAAYVTCTYGRSKETEKCRVEYENRPIENWDDDGYTYPYQTAAAETPSKIEN